MFGGGGIPPVVAHLLADIGEFKAKMGEAEAIIGGVTGRGARNWALMGKQAAGIGLVMAGSAALVGYETVHMASEFQTQMERVHTQAGASQVEVEALKSKVLALAGATGQGPVKLAEALYHIESVGYRGAAAMSVLNETAKLASISGANLDETTYGLTSVMQSYGAKAQDAAKWAAFFNGVVGVGDMKMQDFVKSVGTGFFSAAQTFGVSAQSAGAALAFMTDRGQHADSASTHLRMSLALMAAPSQKATNILKSLGLSTTEAATKQQLASGVLDKMGITYSKLAADLRKPDGFMVALQDLKGHLEKSGLSADAANAQLSHAFGGGKSDSTILAMLNNLDTLKSKYDALGKATGTYGESWRGAQDTLKVQTDKAKAAFQSFAIEIGTVLMPYVARLVGWLSRAASYLATHANAAKAAALIIGGVFVAGLALATAGMIAFAIANIAATWEILLIIAAVVAVAVAVVYLWTHWSQVWGWIKDKTGAAATWVKDKVVAMWTTVRDWTVQKWNQVVDAIKGAWNRITGWVSTAWHTVVDPIVAGWNWLRDTTTRVWNSITGFFRKWWPLLLVIFFPAIAIMVAAWNHFHTRVHDTAVKIWNAVYGFLNTRWNNMKANAKAAWELIHRYIVIPMQMVWAYTVAVWDRVKGYLSTKFDQIKRGAQIEWNAFHRYIVDPIERVWARVQKFGSDIWASITGAFGRVMGWLQGLGTSFYNLGVNIVQGMINGIASGVGALMSTVQNMSSGALNAAKNFLGVNSPSRLFADVIGRAIPEGVAKGVVDHSHKANSAVRGMAHGLLGTGAGSLALGSARAASGSSGGGAGTLTLDVPVEVKVDGQVLLKTVQRVALQYQSRNGRPAFSV